MLTTSRPTSAGDRRGASAVAWLPLVCAAVGAPALASEPATEAAPTSWLLRYPDALSEPLTLVQDTLTTTTTRVGTGDAAPEYRNSALLSMVGRLSPASCADGIGAVLTLSGYRDQEVRSELVAYWHYADDLAELRAEGCIAPRGGEVHGFARSGADDRFADVDEPEFDALLATVFPRLPAEPLAIGDSFTVRERKPLSLPDGMEEVFPEPPVREAVTVWKLAEADAGGLGFTLERTAELERRVAGRGALRYEQRGTGRASFDRARGLFREVHMDATTRLSWEPAADTPVAADAARMAWSAAAEHDQDLCLGLEPAQPPASESDDSGWKASGGEGTFMVQSVGDLREADVGVAPALEASELPFARGCVGRAREGFPFAVTPVQTPGGAATDPGVQSAPATATRPAQTAPGEPGD